jgi:ATP-dependent RNA helicase DDX55/SPB4
MGTDVTDLARAGLRNPRRVTVTVPSRGGRRYATPHEVRNSWAVVPQSEKLSALLGLLRELRAAGGAGGAGGHKTMVFVLTCAAVEYLARLLPALPECAGLRVVGLHGQMPQKRRERTYAEFGAPPPPPSSLPYKVDTSRPSLRTDWTRLVPFPHRFVAAREGVLLCTDVAARGLDVPGLSAVVQWDAPQDPAFAVHRAGRVGRLGQAAAGESVLLLAPSEEGYVPLLRSRGMGLQDRPAPAGPPSSALLASARAALRGDRDLHQKSQRAFVSQAPPPLPPVQSGHVSSIPPY